MQLPAGDRSSVGFVSGGSRPGRWFASASGELAFVIILDVICGSIAVRHRRSELRLWSTAGGEPDACTASATRVSRRARSRRGNPPRDSPGTSRSSGRGSERDSRGATLSETVHSGCLSVEDVSPGRITGPSFEGNLGVDVSRSDSREGDRRRVRGWWQRVRWGQPQRARWPLVPLRRGWRPPFSRLRAVRRHTDGGGWVSMSAWRGNPADALKGWTVWLRPHWKSPGSTW